MAKTVEGLHVVIDTQIEQAVLAQIIEAQPAAIQLREKGLSKEVQERIADFGSDLRQRLKDSDTLFVLNDHVSLGVRLGANIVHVGQNDMPANKVAKLLTSDMGFGVSVQTTEQGLIAQQEGALYVGLPVWPSLKTKLDALPEGLERVSLISSALNIPVIGIGGIKRGNAHLVMRQGARGIAVAGEVNRARDPKDSALALKQIIFQYNR